LIFSRSCAAVPVDPRKPLGLKRDFDVHRDRRKSRKPAKIEVLLTHSALRRNTRKAGIWLSQPSDRTRY
jgi:hypothetical protein